MQEATDLSDGEKFDFLWQACQGETKNATENLAYKEALKNLENVYGNLYRQMQCHVQKFLNIKPVAVASASALQAFYNGLCKCEDEIKQCVHEYESDVHCNWKAGQRNNPNLGALSFVIGRIVGQY